MCSQGLDRDCQPKALIPNYHATLTLQEDPMSPSLEGHLMGSGCFLCIRLLFHFPFSKPLVYVESNSWEGRLSQLLDLGNVFCISNMGVGKCDNTVSPESGGPGTSPGFPPAMGLHDSEMS